MPILNRVDDSFEFADVLPVLALRDLVFFPYMVLPLLIGRPRSVEALEEAEAGDGILVLVTQRDGTIDDPGPGDLCRVGTFARILQTARLPDGTARVVLEGLGRAEIDRFVSGAAVFRAAVAVLEDSLQGEVDSAAEDVVAQVQVAYREYVRLSPRVPDELLVTLSAIRDRSRLGSLMAGHLLVAAQEKQRALEAVGVEAQFGVLAELVTRELEILRIEEKLDRQIELRRRGEPLPSFASPEDAVDDTETEWAELDARIEGTVLPGPVRERCEREFGRLVRMNAATPEASVVRTYLDWLLALPWSQRTEDMVEVAHASRILDEAHFGLDEVKERILDHIAVLSLVKELKGPILCLAGPPGVGKTSLGRSIAEALGREFVRVSLGGVRDEAEIRGHRRTYVGALPGRIIQGMRKAGSRNPVFLLDEVDKMARDFHGDPGAALLEVLDPEQNRTFTDHYLELEYDLSDVLFVATANSLAGIPDALRDRMEVIRLAGYLGTEKKVIARRFLWPKHAEGHGLASDLLVLEDSGLECVVNDYTREAGVRELGQRFARIARKMARRVATQEGGALPALTLDASAVRQMLGPPPYPSSDRDQDVDRVGIANGLAWTAAGGEVLDVEVAVVPGSGQIRLTGTLGDVMKESAFAAMTYARARGPMLGLGPDFHQSVDIHIHLPEGATPKDGPSAGITIAVALISALTATATRPDVAMTGEITLRGRVLPVGGIKEKAVAAMRSGIPTVLLPHQNLPDLDLLPKEVREGVKFVPVRSMDEVLSAALAHLPLAASERGAAHLPVHGSTDAGVQISQ